MTMMPLHECVVCDATIWPVTEGYLCVQHLLWKRVLRQNPTLVAKKISVDHGRLTDFYGRNHRLELFVPSRAPRHWDVETGDLLRVLGVRYDATNGNGEGSSAA